MTKYLLIAGAAALAASSLTAPGYSQPPRRVTAPTTRFSIDSKITALIANPGARAALDRHMPTLRKSPHLGQFQNMSIRELAANPHAVIATAKIRALQADLIKIR